MDYVWDIDGTLADCSHREHYVRNKPKDWVKFYGGMINDKPHWDMVHILHALRTDHPANHVILCTGRPEEYREDTLHWFETNGIPYDALYMRAADDHRTDNVVKVELIRKIQADGYDPKIVFEDRTRVVKAFREIGLRVLQVRDGDF